MLPPPIIDAAKVVAFAIVGPDREFNAAKALWVGDVRVGRVPKLAITEGSDASDFLVLFCDEEWRSIAIVGAKSLDDAKHRASAFYPDIQDAWQAAPYSQADVERFIEAIYGTLRCSFCGRLPFEVAALFEVPSARICDTCIKQYRDKLDG